MTAQAPTGSVADALRYLKNAGAADPASDPTTAHRLRSGGSLRRHLTPPGYSFDLLRRIRPGSTRRDATHSMGVSFSPVAKTVAWSTSTAAARRRLRPSLPAWPQGWLVCRGTSAAMPEVILVKDCSTMPCGGRPVFAPHCSLGAHLNPGQFRQLCDGPRTVYLTFDVDANGSGNKPRSASTSSPRARYCTRRVLLPQGHDPTPSSSRADACQFQSLLEAAHMKFRLIYQTSPNARSPIPIIAPTQRPGGRRD